MCLSMAMSLLLLFVGIVGVVYKLLLIIMVCVFVNVFASFGGDINKI